MSNTKINLINEKEGGKRSPASIPHYSKMYLLWQKNNSEMYSLYSFMYQFVNCLSASIILSLEKMDKFSPEYIFQTVIIKLNNTCHISQGIFFVNVTIILSSGITSSALITISFIKHILDT